MIDSIIEILSYTIPSLVTGLVAYYFFLRLSRAESHRMKFDLMKEDKKIMLPVRLQAYERLTLFLERINPSKLLIRVTPTNEDKDLYVQKLIQSIEQEFEYNLAQQIYVSSECWNVIITAKNATSQIVKKTAENTDIINSNDLRKAIIQRMIEGNPPSLSALSYIKEEVEKLY